MLSFHIKIQKFIITKSLIGIYGAVETLLFQFILITCCWEKIQSMIFMFKSLVNQTP